MTELKTLDEIEEKIQAQKKFCVDNKIPHFAPGVGFAPNDGICYACRAQIYIEISLEKAKTELIIGCPFCHRSYCD